ncbi:tryptophan-rich sensory protein [Butyricicoccus faecihominis]|uniref:TspO/MBR family protein n=1 Tax=Butyricicoccus faecihominis TaxID=1712515 RepID=UPI002478F637|nr:TspO/MBR family protein [Butyricicoccus faecihominis]MCQ5130984.1 tryptophan-rich sensory protein [Butyricicoccus faecihominis]
MGLTISILIPLLVGGAAARLTTDGFGLYQTLVKPPLAPPAWVFPAVWTVLYILMGIAAYLVSRSQAPTERKRQALIAYGVQLAVNFVWPLLFFRSQTYLTAFWWLVLLIAVVAVTIWDFASINRRAAALMVPYLIWLVFAGYLNLAFYWLNQ